MSRVKLGSGGGVVCKRRDESCGSGFDSQCSKNVSSASAPPRSFSLFSSFPFEFTMSRYNLPMLGFEPQISGVGKRPLCQLSHHHCPKVKLGQ